MYHNARSRERQTHGKIRLNNWRQSHFMLIFSTNRWPDRNIYTSFPRIIFICVLSVILIDVCIVRWTSNYVSFTDCAHFNMWSLRTQFWNTFVNYTPPRPPPCVWGTRWRIWLRYWATSRKVAGSIPDGVIGIFHWRSASARTVAVGLT
jgi:hypothetical protein